jgi:uncharacterized glyoxalase superfamily protein PhnB
MELKFGSVVLFVDEVHDVLDFYMRAFGCRIRFYDPGYDFGELEAGGTAIGIGSHACGERLMPGRYARASHGGTAGVEIAFYADDVAAAYERALSAGAAPLAAPRRTEWGQEVAYVRSPEGTVVGLCSPPAASERVDAAIRSAT